MNIVKKLYYTLKGVADHPLNRDAKLRSCLSFCVSQVALRLVPGDVAVVFPNDQRLVIAPRMKGMALFFPHGLCEFEEMCFVAHFLRPADLFADVGANVGAYTVLASGVAGSRSVAFEPSPGTFTYLARNVGVNGLGEHAKAVHAAVGAREGEITLTENLGTENFVCPDQRTGQTVPLTTLDTVFADGSPTLMKVDVEGYETEVFAGAARLLGDQALRAMIVERAGNAERYGFSEEALHARLRAQGFQVVSYSPFERALRLGRNDAPGNIVYVRDPAEAQERVRTAPRFQFAGREI